MAPQFTSDAVDKTLFKGERYWRLEAGPDHLPLGIIYGDNAVWLTFAEQAANVALIAAAPELLAALEDALGRIESFENNGDEIADALAEKCRAAIAKARGK